MANATRYFDLTPAAAGFGTLTGAWDTTTANWTASSAGASGTNTAYTFDNTDTAQFGFTGTTATAGIATISTGITVTLNQIVTANLAAGQTIAASGTGTLNLAGTTPTINVGSAGGLTISAPITGTAGFTKSGSGALTLTNTTVANNISGPLTITAGGINCGSYTIEGTQLAGITSVSFPSAVTLASPQQVVFYGTTSYTSAITSATGSGGRVIVTGQRTGSGITFAAGALAGLTGQTQATNDFSNAQGFMLYGDSTAGARAPIATINDLPDAIGYDSYPGISGTNVTFDIFYTGPAVNKNTKIFVGINGATNYPAFSFHRLYANGTGALKMSGGIVRGGAAPTAGTATFTLSGTTLFDNEISGPITEDSSRVLAITKEQAGKWILSGASTFTGGVTVSAGTLSAQSAGAFGSSTTGAVSQTGGIIDVSGGVTVNKASTTLTLVSVASATNLSSTSGTNTYTCAGVTLNSTAVIDVASGASLNLNNSAAMSGTGFGITKTSAGEFILSNTANTFTGAITVSAGTLTAVKLANASATSSIGTGAGTSAIALTGTLKHTGTTVDSTDRSITFTGSAPAIDASGTGSGAVTFSAATQAAGARTITFTGSGTNNNTFGAALSNGTGTVAITKDGVGKWIFSNATLNFTGDLTVANGTLDLNSTARTLAANIAVSGGTLQNGSATVAPATSITMTGGTITANLTGASKTLTVSSGSATLAPQATNNAGLTGGTATIAGTLRLTAETSDIGTTGGKVLGSMATMVQNGGTIQTTTGTLQRGQHRYGGNLTFQAGATLRIGG